MQVEYAFLADAAEAPPQSGKLYVLGGGIDEIRASQFPTVHPHMALVLKLRLHATECDRQHKLEIELWDPDGNRIAPPLSTDFSLSRRPSDVTRPVYLQTVLDMVAMVFPRPGAYAFHIIVDGQHLKDVQLYLDGPAQGAIPPAGQT